MTVRFRSLAPTRRVLAASQPVRRAAPGRLNEAQGVREGSEKEEDENEKHQDFAEREAVG